MLDYNNDRWPDVYVANDSSASLLFHNNGDGTFKDVGLQAGAALTADGRAQAGMGVGAGDYNRDGWLDLVKTNFDDDTTSLYRNLGGGNFEDATTEAGLGVNTRYLGWGTGFLDFDLDSWPDIFIVNGHVYPEADRIGGHYTYPQRKLLYRNLGNGRFADVSLRAGAGIARQEGVSRRSRRRPLQYRPTGHRRQQHARHTDLAPQLRAPPEDTAWSCSWWERVRTAARIGARVTVHVAGRRLVDEVRSGGSFCSQNDLRIHVGLGARSRADRVEVAGRAVPRIPSPASTGIRSWSFGRAAASSGENRWPARRQRMWDGS